MGFEPFTPPKRIIPADKLPATTREEKVIALAKTLHERGITSSMADAKRLAEGMVDIEKKVMKPAVKEEPKPQPPAAQLKQTFGLNLPESFAHFVAQAAAISHEETKPSTIPELHEKPVTYGREATQTVAAVPHVHAHKQVFFEDAPDLTKARGFKSAEIKTARPPEMPEQKPQPQTVMRVSTGDDAVKVTKVETAPHVEIVEERMIIKEETIEEELKDNPATTTEMPKPEKPRETVDLAKQHGVDLFQMFKKK
jgi:hypothetical protein